MRCSAFAFAALLALALLSGCGLLHAEVEARTVCATLADHAFPGADQAGEVDTDVTYDLGDVPLLSDSGTGYDLRLERVELELGSASGLADLSGLEAAQVSILSPPGAGLPEPVLVSYVRPPDAHPTEIALDAPTHLDLEPYVQDGQVTLHAHAAGTLPTAPWRATLKACFTLTVKLDYGSRL